MAEQGRWSWLQSRPQRFWHVAALAGCATFVAYAASLLFGRRQVEALIFAVVFGLTTLLIQSFRLYRWHAAGRPSADPPNLPPYGGEWPPAH